MSDTKKKDNNVYIRKSNGRYEPIGICTNLDYMSDGIWYIHHDKYGKGYTSIPYIAGMFRVSDASDISVPMLCGMEDMCNKIMESDIFNEVTKGPCSLSDIVHACVRVMHDETLLKLND